ncbi:hypothetical protein RHGRI_019427 [Rhododendron griersonianum]|uniref:Uncharacterized protein n=1 Tax=Rhododendron griersonianum TaxID=479676 RepID=A0AAV6JF84_9ERIC|nr:hypothetical protein RHGRI_019427 [Rhododendron griersonianum]
MKNERINALGLQKTAHVLIGSSQKRKSNKTEQAKKMMKKMMDDEDFQTPEGEDEFCSSSDEEELIPSTGLGKRFKTMTPLRSTCRSVIVPPVESTMAHPPAQDSLLAPTSSQSIPGNAVFFFSFVFFFG